jgi:4-alpha-glucanotransferase
LIALLMDENLLEGEVDLTQPIPLAVAAAIHAFASATPSLLALVQADDLAGKRVAVNLPGTDTDRPNWRRRLDLDGFDVCHTPLARAILGAMRSRAMPDVSPGEHVRRVNFQIWRSQSRKSAAHTCEAKRNSCLVPGQLR